LEKRIPADEGVAYHSWGKLGRKRFALAAINLRSEIWGKSGGAPFRGERSRDVASWKGFKSFFVVDASRRLRKSITWFQGMLEEEE